MSGRDSAILSVALLVGTIALVVCMLGAKTPTTHLPEGTLLFDVVRARLVAFEAVGEFGFASSTPLA